MNLLEHYIEEIYYVTDITDEYTKNVGKPPKEPLLEVGIRVKCYGVEENIKRTFFKSNWEQANKNGYYMA